MFKKLLFSIFVLLFTFNSYAVDFQVNEDQTSVEKTDPEPKNTLYIELKDGIVIAELFPNIAPMHVQRIRTLTQSGFYDNIKFHRVIDRFMAQTGDPTGTGRGGSKLGKLYAEFNNEHHTRGTLSMARSSDPNSANSQFFIVTGEFFPELDGQYTIFGRVIEGMDYVDKIKAGDTSKNGMVDNPDRIIKVITGDMLNNKSLATVKEEIKLVNDMQIEKAKEDINYQKKSVLGILLEAKDIDMNQDNPVNSEENNNNTVDNTENNAVNNTDKNTQNNNTTTNTPQNIVPTVNNDSKTLNSSTNK